MVDPSSKRWQPMDAWTDTATAGRGGAIDDGVGVRIELCQRLRMIGIIARKGRNADLAHVLADRYGCALPEPGRAAAGRGWCMVCLAPDQWLFVQTGPTGDTDIMCRLAGIAAVTDQSDARAILRVSGARVQDALAKGFAIDFHPSVFTKGSAATTKVAYISVHIWQTDEAPTYMIAVPLSLASSFWSWLTAASAAYGYEVV